MGGEKRKGPAPSHWLHATLSVRAPATKGRGMHGSGMFVINPPWTLEAALNQALPFLVGTLALDDHAAWHIETFEQAAT